MSNLKNFNFNKIDAFLSESEYYDFYLAQDEYSYVNYTDGIISGDCLVVYYDFNESGIYSSGTTSADTIFSLVTWNEAINTGYTFDYFGLTGIDNGLITYTEVSGDTSNAALLSAITGTVITVTSGDTRLTLNKVTGMTNDYIYPITIVSNDTILGDYSSYCGGFYQGYYKLDGYSYEVLPVRVPNAWVAEFWVNKSDYTCSGTTGTTLNEVYPDNKGFFFYMGTRAENKYWNIFEGLNTGCTSGCTSDTGCTDTVTEYCTIPKETDIYLTGDTSGFPIPLSPPPLEIQEVTNPFLIYGRASTDSSCNSCGAPSGLGNQTVCSYSGQNIYVSGYTQVITDTTNPFLIYGRASTDSGCNSCGDPSGFGNQTVCSYSGYSQDELELDKDLDIIDNAIGFRIKDDGSIGYRALKQICYGNGESSYTAVTIEEQYSISGLVLDNQWEHIAIRFVMPEYDECELKYGKPRKGRLMIYINSYLKVVFEDVDEFIARRLNEYKDKQLGVPFNISLGGGSQGLIESMTFDGRDPDDLGLKIEENYAGTFIGDISQFRFYICDLTWCSIKNNYNEEKERYREPVDTDGYEFLNTIYFGKHVTTVKDDSFFSTLDNKVNVIEVNKMINITNDNEGYIHVLIPTNNSLPNKIVLGDNCNNLKMPFNLLPNKIVVGNTEFNVLRSFNKTFYNGDLLLCM